MEKAKKLLGGFAAYTPTSANYFKKMNRWHTSNPQAGDIVFYKNSTRIYHTGYVYKVSGGKIYTIEGNTSNASGVVANGGGVAKKSYSVSYIRIAGYGRPDYSIVGGSESTTSSITTKTEAVTVDITLNQLSKGNKGKQVKTLQMLLKGFGYSVGNSGVDGDFGPATLAAVNKFQKDNGLGVDGIVGENTWTALLK